MCSAISKRKIVPPSHLKDFVTPDTKRRKRPRQVEMTAPAKHLSSFCDATVKQEPVEDNADLTPDPAFEYVTVKQETTEWEVPDVQDSTQDPLNICKEECSPSEDLPVCSTSNIEKQEDVEDEEKTLSADDGGKLELPDDQDSTQDPLNICKEECSPSEDLLMCSSSNIEKQEHVEDEEKTLTADDGRECSSSEDFLEASACGTGKSGDEEGSEDEEDEEDVRKNDFKAMGQQKRTKAGTMKFGTRIQYSTETLQKVLEDIRAGRIGQREAARRYNIPRSTIINKLYNRHCGKIGGPTAFTEVEEKSFVGHCITLSDMGLQISIPDLRCIVKSFLDNSESKVDCFAENMPTIGWGRKFFNRHRSELSHIFTLEISRLRAAVNEDVINTFFEKYKHEVEGVPAENVFSFDENRFHGTPKKGKLLFRRTCRHPELLEKTIKINFTVVHCGNAAGEFLPPYIIVKGKQKMYDWINSYPPGTQMNYSKSGWIEQGVFEDWFQTHFLPYARKKVGRRVIIGDNLTSHISIKILELCEQNSIRFICLPPNTTCLLQPLNVAYFPSLEKNWSDVLSQWRDTPEGKKELCLPKGTFSSLLAKALQLGEQTASTNLVKGFEKCGLYPVNCGRVLQSLQNYAGNESFVMTSVGNEFKRYSQTIRDSDHCVKDVQKYRGELRMYRRAGRVTLAARSCHCMS